MCYFVNYFFVCLEQKIFKVIGLCDEVVWQKIVVDLLIYLDGDGLVYYFLFSDSGVCCGSDMLMVYLLVVINEVGYVIL